MFPLKQKGFTLIEVLIALIILAVAMMAIIMATGASVRNTVHVQNDMQSRWIGLNVINKIQAGILPLPQPSQVETGKSVFLRQNWKWVAGVAQTGATNYERIYVDVSTKGAHSRMKRLVGFVYLS